ncbi:hypothetical protein E2W85_11800 [Salmonella enterica]|nr:hypothetical protein [Salmonella enterica]EEG9158536.1 hypothetical protein [Salmonella enterica]
MLSKDPFNTKSDVARFKEEASKYFTSEQDLNVLTSIFKLSTLLNILIAHNASINHKTYIQGIIYDSLNSIIAIFSLRERYLHLNLRSIIEHIARIALNKNYQGNDFDGTVRRKDFDFLKQERTNEDWKFMHETYIRACHYVHSSPEARLNVNSTFVELMAKDNSTKPSKQILNLQKILSSTIKIFMVYFEPEISSTFYRTQGELKYLLGASLYKEYENLSGRLIS